MYVIEAFCDKCGGRLLPTGICLPTYPVQYPYACETPGCNGHETFWEDECPGKIEYEFEEDKDV